MTDSLGRALIVDDESSTRDSLQSKIRQESTATVDVAGNAADGVKHLMGAKYALIFVDLDLIRGSFGDCVRSIRPQPITIGMTAAADFEIDVRDAALVHAVIRKPEDLERIANVAVGILQTAQRR
jgi:DNA-binding NtrC family response regulator